MFLFTCSLSSLLVGAHIIQEKDYAIVHAMLPCDLVKKVIQKEETIAAKSFPDDEDDEKVRLEGEGKREHKAITRKIKICDHSGL